MKISNNHVSSDNKRVADGKMQAPAVSTGQGTKRSLGHIQNITEINPADISTWVRHRETEKEKNRNRPTVTRGSGKLQ